MDVAALRALVEEHATVRGPLLPVLHAVQERYGHVPPEAVPAIAEALNVSRAEVHGVITFYDDLRTEPPAAHTLRLCQAEACQAVGAVARAQQAEQRLGTRLGGRTADGRVALERVFCLGNCALGPAAQVDGRLIGRLDEAALDGLLEELA